MPKTPRTIERWKLELIRARALRRGLRDGELDDAQQEIAIEVMAFSFRPERSNGATEVTAVTAVIDRRLAMIRRRQRRYRQRFEVRDHALMPSGAGKEPAEPATGARFDLLTDIRAILAGLRPEDRELCLRLADGMSIDAIAGQLGCGWHTVRRRIDRLRAEFERQGFDGRDR